MPNSRYVKGRQKEYAQIHKLQELGFPRADIIRASGSHGTFDIVGIDRIRHIIRLVQVKSGKTAERERKRIKDELRAYTGAYWVEGEVA